MIELFTLKGELPTRTELAMAWAECRTVRLQVEDNKAFTLQVTGVKNSKRGHFTVAYFFDPAEVKLPEDQPAVYRLSLGPARGVLTRCD